MRWAQILMNLLHNAGKFAPDGGVISIQLRTLHEGSAELRVQDDGMGIAGSQLQRIFGIFQRGPRSPRGTGGLGLGLALVRELVDLHGGRIHAESEGPGRGATFVVRVPLLDRERSTAGPMAGRPTRP